MDGTDTHSRYRTPTDDTRCQAELAEKNRKALEARKAAAAAANAAASTKPLPEVRPTCNL